MTSTERHGQAWTAEEEERLYHAFTSGKTANECAALHQRKPGGVKSRLLILGLLDEEFMPVQPPPAFTASAAAQKRTTKAVAVQEKREQAKASRQLEVKPELNERFREALALMEGSNRHLFITGKAGTGKSTLLSYFCRTTEKQPVVLAPTGVAALNVKGQTIHRFFNFYIDVTRDQIIHHKIKPRNPKLYKNLKTIIIDEISMVRADLLDCVEAFLNLHGPQPGQPFGGVQMIFIGDLYQLPPVVAPNEKELFASIYPTPYFFSAQALAETELTIIELNHVYRQKDPDFVALLNRIRNNSVTPEDIQQLNSRVGKTATGGAMQITLTTTNATADGINDKHLAALSGKLRRSLAEVAGDFGREYFPTQPELSYKIGAQIMLLNNDTERRWVNGSIAVIEAVQQDEEGEEYLAVRLQDDARTVAVHRHSWEVYRFALEDGDIVSKPVGTFTQYPFRLAWTITIHKSQGKTFDRVAIDVGRGAFAAGQMYVAFSRCTSFNGITLSVPVRASDIRTDHRIFAFHTGYQYQLAAQEMPVADKISLIQTAIREKSLLNIVYLKADDTKTERQVLPRTVGKATYQGKDYDGMKALCTLRQEERMFRVDRILKIAKVG